jgi:hypothetical protein
LPPNGSYPWAGLAVAATACAAAAGVELAASPQKWPRAVAPRGCRKRIETLPWTLDLITIEIMTLCGRCRPRDTGHAIERVAAAMSYAIAGPLHRHLPEKGGVASPNDVTRLKRRPLRPRRRPHRPEEPGPAREGPGGCLVSVPSIRRRGFGARATRARGACR